jgi:hypothetical protein
VPKVIADAIDHLCAIEMRFAAELPRGVIWPLYEAAREAQGGDPLVYLAAERLLENVGRGDYVLIVTGSGTRFGLPKGETDGPLGAASLGRALDFGLGARVVFVCEEAHRDPVVATVEAAGISVLDHERLEKRVHSTVVETLPPGRDRGQAFAKEVLHRYHPKAVVFIEKTGPNQEGKHCSIMGSAKPPDEVGYAHFLADLARERGVFTLGIGDGGNEIGFGMIREAVQRIQPHPEVATVTSTDVLVACSVSNWGAYGVSAQLAARLKDPDVLQTEEMEDFMLRQCVAAGGTDGAYAAQILYVDGTSLRVQLALVSILREIVTNGLKTVTRAF